MPRLVVGPFNRVEGDLEVQLDCADGRVRAAWVHAPMYRGFEQILPGRDARDALVIAPRICGICSVSQSVAAARALADLAGLRSPPNGLHATNLMLACENLADHLSHFYLFFMPDFTRPVYAARPWFETARERFAPGSGSHARLAIAARQRWFMLLGTLGGRWPHTHSIDPGGSSRAIEAAERLRLLARVHELRHFLEQTLFGAPLEEVLALADDAALHDWLARAPRQGDLRLFLEIAADLQLDQLGAGPGRFLSYGAYAQPDGAHAFGRGVWLGAQHAPSTELQPLDPADIREDLSHAWLTDAGTPLHPQHGETLPQADKPGAYSWNKAPRLAGAVVETGAIARQLASGQPLVLDAVRRSGGNVRTRVLARLIEIACLVPLMSGWLQALVPREPFCDPRSQHTALPDGAGAGLLEAARGALGHWISVRGGRIERYQIIAPTSWNFSPRDAAGTPGALEAALQGAPVQPGETTPVAVQHIVRSFDPCMVCTVH